jgi:transglycosylase-like protein with SLT domain
MAVAATVIGGVTVPSEYVLDVENAASQLGIPASIVANQIYYESAFNPNALSPTGAQGIAQFEPPTWAQYGTGSPDNPTDAFAAYVKYMSVLLKQENGNVFNALAAYNAGPGNLSAGDGYAQHIFSGAGLLKGLLQGATGTLSTTSAGNGATEGGQGVAGTATGTGSWTSALGTLYNDVTGGLLSWPGAIVGTFGDIDKVVGDAYDGAKLFFQPSTYVRIGSGLFGAMFIILGIVCLAKEASNS